MQGVPRPEVVEPLGHFQATMKFRYAPTCDTEVETAAKRIGTTISERPVFPFSVSGIHSAKCEFSTRSSLRKLVNFGKRHGNRRKCHREGP